MSEDEEVQTAQNRWVLWKEGSEILGLSRQSFFYLVESGQVRKRKGKNARDGRYSLVDILQVKEARASGKPRKPRPPKPVNVEYGWLLARDIPACLRLDQLVYDKMLLAQAAQYEQWVSHNPRIAMAAFDARDRNICLAYVSILPLPEQVIIDILSGKRDELSIQASEIETYDRPGGYTLLVNSAVRHPDRPDLLFSTINRIMSTWLEWYPERYIRRVYAQGYSNEGDRLIQYFFMSPLYHLAPNAYMLDLARPGMARPIRRFQEALQAKGTLPEEMQPTYAPALPVYINTAIKRTQEKEHIAPPALDREPRVPRYTTGEQAERPAETITLRELCAVLGVAESTIKTHLGDGHYESTRVPYGKLNKHYFTPEQVEAARQYHRTHRKISSRRKISQPVTWTHKAPHWLAFSCSVYAFSA